MRRALVVAALALTACAESDPRQDAIQKYALTEAQIPIMDAFLQGLARESATATSRRTREEIAACYAARHTVPARWLRLHIAYISDYPNADKDYYAWFAARGVSEADAYAIWQGVDAPSKDCLRKE